MEKSYISKGDIERFKASLEATVNLGKAYGIQFTPPERTTYNSLDAMMVVATERLDKSSKRLNCLTIILTALTLVLAVVGIFNIVVVITG